MIEVGKGGCSDETVSERCKEISGRESMTPMRDWAPISHPRDTYGSGF